MPAGGLSAGFGVLLATALVLPAATAIYAAATLRTLGVLHGTADLVVVLGGEARARPEAAARLYVQGRTRNVLVSGAGDCMQSQAALLRAGVPRSAILLDCTSSDTWQNALNAGKVARALDAHRVVVVTSWFHVPRAMMCFALTMPGRDLFAASVHEAAGDTWEFDTARRLGSEYVKTGWYMLRHGTVPFGLSGGPLNLPTSDTHAFGASGVFPA